jgi:hypothetical protein
LVLEAVLRLLLVVAVQMCHRLTPKKDTVFTTAVCKRQQQQKTVDQGHQEQ